MASLIHQDHAEHMEQLKAAVEQIFPILCYSNEKIQQFVNSSQKNDGSGSYRFELASGQAALMGLPGLHKHPSQPSISYIVPTDWNARYQIVQATVAEIIAEAQKQGASGIFASINEDVPSHNAYYAGILPLLGFDMTPRARLVAPLGSLSSLNLPQLPNGITEAAFSEERIAEIVEVCHVADMTHYPNCSEEEKEQKKRGVLQDIERCSQREDHVKTWTMLIHDDRVIGLSIGSKDTWMKTLDIVHLWVLPQFHGQRLGRYLFIRCMQKLHQHFVEPGWRFFVGTSRDWRPAMRLYTSLGFWFDDRDPSAIIYARCKLSTATR